MTPAEKMLAIAREQEAAAFKAVQRAHSHVKWREQMLAAERRRGVSVTRPPSSSDQGQTGGDQS